MSTLPGGPPESPAPSLDNALEHTARSLVRHAARLWRLANPEAVSTVRVGGGTAPAAWIDIADRAWADEAAT